MFRRSAKEMSVLILAPVGRDAALLAGTLEGLKIDTQICADARELLETLEEGAGATIIADEAINADEIQAFHDWVDAQPPWSDLPFIILTASGRPTHGSRHRAHQLETLGNFTLIERPVRPETVESTVRSALRARMRQYEVRSRQEALLRANADLEQFAHSASHDLREPIRSISIYSELLGRSYGSLFDERGAEFLNTIRTNAKRMEELLNDLLSYAHASSIPDETPQPVRASVPLDAAIENLAGAIRESGAEIAVGDLPAVRMRESHLAQVFQNLVGNAIKYRNEGVSPHIHISARKVSRYWQFSVLDNGIGVPEEYRETIFGIFKRLHTKSQYSGSGMGLAICQRIVERYRGRIWVESAPGCGSNFLFTIPA
jgi:signal transduction histidine kinase